MFSGQKDILVSLELASLTEKEFENEMMPLRKVTALLSLFMSPALLQAN